MSKWKISGIAVAAIAVLLSLINASWIAPSPRGRLLMVAYPALAIRPAFERRIVEGDDLAVLRLLDVHLHHVRA